MKSRQYNTNVRTPTVAVVGRDRGKATAARRRNGLASSSRADSTTVRGMRRYAQR